MVSLGNQLELELDMLKLKLWQTSSAKALEKQLAAAIIDMLTAAIAVTDVPQEHAIHDTILPFSLQNEGIFVLIVFDVQKCIILLSTFLMTKNIVLSNWAVKMVW